MADQPQPATTEHWLTRPTSCWLVALAITTLLALIAHRSQDSALASAFYFAISLGWMSLAGLWLALGSSRIRFAIVGLGYLIASIVAAADSIAIYGLVFLFLHGVVIVCVWIILQLVRYTMWGELHRIKNDEPFSEAIRFGLKQMFIFISVAAVAIAIGKYALKHRGDFALFLGVGTNAAVCSLATTWAFLGQKVMWKSVVTLAVFAIGLVANIQMLAANLDVVVFSVTSWIVTLGYMLSLRAEGYRFVFSGNDLVQSKVAHPGFENDVSQDNDQPIRNVAE